MKKSILFMLIPFILFAEDMDVSGKFNARYGVHQQQEYENEGIKYNTDALIITTLQFNIDYNDGLMSFQATPFFSLYGTNSGSDYKNNNLPVPYDKGEVFFKSLYASYGEPYFKVGAGVLPLTDSEPSKFNDDYIQEGEGISMLNETPLTSVFVKSEYQNLKFIAGLGTLEELVIPVGTYIGEALLDNSEVIFAIVTADFDKLNITAEYLHNDLKFYGNEDLGVLQNIGMSFSYDDSLHSGFSLYGTIGGSAYENKSIDAKDAILTKYSIPDVAVQYYPESFAFNNDTYYGAAGMLGFRQDFDCKNVETFINFEYFHTFGDWSSGNLGNFYTGKNNMMLSVRDDSYYANFGYIMNENTMLRLTWQYAEFDEEGKIGAPASTIKTQDYFGKKLGTTSEVNLNLNIKF